MKRRSFVAIGAVLLLAASLGLAQTEADAKGKNWTITERQDALKKDIAAGKWDSSASGHLDSGEDYDACAVREVREEIGLRLTEAPPRLFKLAACAETDQEHVWVYRCRAEGPFQLDPEEIERGGWFAPDEVTRWMTERPEDFASALLVIWRKQIRRGA